MRASWFAFATVLFAVCTAVPLHYERDVLLDTEGESPVAVSAAVMKAAKQEGVPPPKVEGTDVANVASALHTVYKEPKPAKVAKPKPAKPAKPAKPHEHHIVDALHVVHKEKTPPPPKKKAPKPKKVVYAPATKVVAAAVDKVWTEHDWKAHFTKDLKNKHWHCRHCHKKCKALECHRWCHKEYCGPHYDGSVVLGKYSVGRIKSAHHFDEHVTGNMEHSIKKVNDRLLEVDHAKHYSEFRHAEEAMQDYERARKEDFEHFKRQLSREDSLDKAAYGSKSRRKQRKLVNHLRRKYHRAASETRAKSRIRRAMKQKRMDDAYSQGGKSRMKVMSMMSGGNWEKAVLKASAASASSLNDSSSGSSSPEVSATRVAAKLAAIGVRVKNLKDEATQNAQRASSNAKAVGM